MKSFRSTLGEHRLLGFALEGYQPGRTPQERRERVQELSNKLHTLAEIKRQFYEMDARVTELYNNLLKSDSTKAEDYKKKIVQIRKQLNAESDIKKRGGGPWHESGTHSVNIEEMVCEWEKTQRQLLCVMEEYEGRRASAEPTLAEPPRSQPTMAPPAPPPDATPVPPQSAPSTGSQSAFRQRPSSTPRMSPGSVPPDSLTPTPRTPAPAAPDIPAPSAPPRPADEPAREVAPPAERPKDTLPKPANTDATIRTFFGNNPNITIERGVVTLPSGGKMQVETGKNDTITFPEGITEIHGNISFPDDQQNQIVFPTSLKKIAGDVVIGHTMNPQAMNIKSKDLEITGNMRITNYWGSPNNTFDRVQKYYLDPMQRANVRVGGTIFLKVVPEGLEGVISSDSTITLTSLKAKYPEYSFGKYDDYAPAPPTSEPQKTADVTAKDIPAPKSTPAAESEDKSLSPEQESLLQQVSTCMKESALTNPEKQFSFDPTSGQLTINGGNMLFLHGMLPEGVRRIRGNMTLDSMKKAGLPTSMQTIEGNVVLRDKVATGGLRHVKGNCDAFRTMLPQGFVVDGTLRVERPLAEDRPAGKGDEAVLPKELRAGTLHTLDLYHIGNDSLFDTAIVDVEFNDFQTLDKNSVVKTADALDLYCRATTGKVLLPHVAPDQLAMLIKRAREENVDQTIIKRLSEKLVAVKESTQPKESSPVPAQSREANPKSIPAETSKELSDAVEQLRGELETINATVHETLNGKVKGSIRSNHYTQKYESVLTCKKNGETASFALIAQEDNPDQLVCTPYVMGIRAGDKLVLSKPFDSAENRTKLGSWVLNRYEKLQKDEDLKEVVPIWEYAKAVNEFAQKHPEFKMEWTRLADGSRQMEVRRIDGTQKNFVLSFWLRPNESVPVEKIQVNKELADGNEDLKEFRDRREGTMSKIPDETHQDVIKKLERLLEACVTVQPHTSPAPTPKAAATPAPKTAPQSALASKTAPTELPMSEELLKQYDALRNSMKGIIDGRANPVFQEVQSLHTLDSSGEIGANWTVEVADHKGNTVEKQVTVKIHPFSPSGFRLTALVKGNYKECMAFDPKLLVNNVQLTETGTNPGGGIMTKDEKESWKALLRYHWYMEGKQEIQEKENTNLMVSEIVKLKRAGIRNTYLVQYVDELLTMYPQVKERVRTQVERQQQEKPADVSSVDSKNNVLVEQSSRLKQALNNLIRNLVNGSPYELRLQIVREQLRLLNAEEREAVVTLVIWQYQRGVNYEFNISKWRYENKKPIHLIKTPYGIIAFDISKNDDTCVLLHPPAPKP